MPGFGGFRRFKLEDHGVTVRFAYLEDGERADPNDLTFDLSE